MFKKIAIFSLIYIASFNLSFADGLRQEQFSLLYGVEEESIPLRYSSLENLMGLELLEALHNLTAENYKESDYKESKTHLYDVIDNFSKRVKTVYSNLRLAKVANRYLEVGDQDEDGYPNDFVNCEHVWPQSKFAKLVPMVSDLHHLYPSLSAPNRMRSDFPFGLVQKEALYSTNTGTKLGHEIFEPSDHDKGNIARAMFYFYTRYYDKDIFIKTDRKGFWDNQVETFLKWNKLDPVDSYEKERNDRIEKFQGNRNPYIDYMGFLDRIGANNFRSKRTK